MIMVFSLYGCAIWDLILRKENTGRVFERKVKWKIIGYKEMW
jgi:hypothetical protein